VCTACLRDRVNEDETAVACPECGSLIPLEDSDGEASETEDHAPVSDAAGERGGTRETRFAPSPCPPAPLTPGDPCVRPNAMWPATLPRPQVTSLNGRGGAVPSAGASRGGGRERDAVTQALRPQHRPPRESSGGELRASDLEIPGSDVSLGPLLCSSSESEVLAGTLRVGSALAPVVVKRVRVPHPGDAVGSLVDHLSEIVRTSWRCPGICRVYGFLPDASGQLGLVMDRHGSTAEDLLETHPGGLPVERALRVAADAARGVAEMHASGVAHLDIKPSNVLLSQSGRALLSDHGLAAALATLSKSRVAWGEAAYLSPECMGEGVGAAPSPASDVWSWACLVISLFSGRSPFPGFNPTQIAHAVAVRAERPEIPRSVPGHLKKLLTQCLSRSPTARPRAAELAAALAEHASEQGPVAPGASGGVDGVMSALLLLGFTPAQVVHAVRRRLGQGLAVDGRALVSDLLHRREVTSGRMEDIVAALAADGVQEVDLCWTEIRVPAKTTLAVTKPGFSIRNGKVIGARGKDQGSAPIVSIRADGCALEAVVVEGGAAKAPAVEVEKARGTLLRGCTVTGGRGRGVQASGDICNVDMEECEVSRVRGVGVEMTQGADLRLTNCRFSECVTGGVHADGSGTTVQIDGGSFDANGVGVSLDNGALAQVTGSSFSGQARGAVTARGRGTRAEISRAVVAPAAASFFSQDVSFIADGGALVQVGRRVEFSGSCKSRRGGRVALPFSLGRQFKRVWGALLALLLAALAYDVLLQLGLVGAETDVAVRATLTDWQEAAAAGWSSAVAGATDIFWAADRRFGERLSTAKLPLAGKRLANMAGAVSDGARAVWGDRRRLTTPATKAVSWVLVRLAVLSGVA